MCGNLIGSSNSEMASTVLFGRVLFKCCIVCACVAFIVSQNAFFRNKK